MAEDRVVAEGGGDASPRVRRKNILFFDLDYRLLDRLAKADGLNHSAFLRSMLRREGRERWPAEAVAAEAGGAEPAGG